MPWIRCLLLIGLFSTEIILDAVASPRSNSSQVHRDSIPNVGGVDTRRLLSDPDPGQWLTGGRDYRQSYYSPLNEINKNNIRDLGFAWSFDIPFDAAFESTPIVVDGVMFTSGNRGDVYSLDSKSGRLRWRFSPAMKPTTNCCQGVNRGVSVWRGRVYVAAMDGQLYSLDADNGTVIWAVDTIADRSRSYSSTGAPYIAGEVVVIGNSGAEYDARGYVSAYKIRTGELAWRFYTVPGNPSKGFEHPELQMASRTWDPNSRWDIGLGGTAWDGMAYDPALNLLYVGTGNGLPWRRDLRSPSGGDNLFLSSILAINPSSGRLVWYYQTTPGDNWDYTATAKLILADLEIDGKPRKVILQAPKNGFFYVLDRITGAFISAKPFVYINWASHVDTKTGRPVETGKADYSQSPKLVFPTNTGAHNWQPMSFNPKTGLVYIPAIEAGEVYANQSTPFVYQSGAWNTGVPFPELMLGANGPTVAIKEGWPSFERIRGNEPNPMPRTYIKAWDPISQSLRWEVNTTGNYLNPSPHRRISGLMSTAGGLVFQGHTDGLLRMYDSEDGELLHQIDIGTSMIAAPMTYSVGSKQYIAVMAGVAEVPGYADYDYGKLGRVVAFSLNGGAKTPRRTKEARPSPVLTKIAQDDATSEQLGLGRETYISYCMSCHSSVARAPVLTDMSERTYHEFLGIVLKGARSNKGMPSFAHVIDESQALAIRSYLVHSAWQEHRATESSSTRSE